MKTHRPNLGKVALPLSNSLENRDHARVAQHRVFTSISRFFSPSLVFVVGLLLSGFTMMAVADYGVESTRPLSDPHKVKIDDRVVGAWSATMKDKDYFLHVGTGNLVEKSNWMEMVLVNPGEKPLFYLHHKIGFSSSLGGQNYMNVANLSVLVSQLRGATTQDLNSQVERFDILKYEVGDGYVDVWPADQKFIREAIKEGKIKGANATIDDNTENLARFITASDAKIFVNKIRYFRVKKQQPQPEKK